MSIRIIVLDYRAGISSRDVVSEYRVEVSRLYVLFGYQFKYPIGITCRDIKLESRIGTSCRNVTSGNIFAMSWNIKSDIETPEQRVGILSGISRRNNTSDHRVWIAGSYPHIDCTYYNVFSDENHSQNIALRYRFGNRAHISCQDIVSGCRAGIYCRIFVLDYRVGFVV